jgi:hypothetical protein
LISAQSIRFHVEIKLPVTNISYFHAKAFPARQVPMKTGLMAEVTNVVTRRKYFVSTIEGCVGGWQTAVYRKKFGPFVNSRNPELFFLVGLEEERAVDRHNRMVTIVRDVDPAN